MPDREFLRQFDKETLINLLEDSAKNWLAHDGLWFLAVERHFDMSKAIELDVEAWIEFTKIEARRILKRLKMEPGGGLGALETALQLRLYARLNVQSMRRINERTLQFEMNDCRVQSSRKRKGLPDFPCKPVGIAEYAHFAHTIDPRIRTSVVTCPPDDHPEDYYCRWQFQLEEIPIPDENVIPS